MNERAVVMGSAVIGAVVGALAGYLFLTDEGRRLRRELEPRLNELADDLERLGDAVVRARDVASQSLRVIGEVTGTQAEHPDWETADTAAY